MLPDNLPCLFFLSSQRGGVGWRGLTEVVGIKLNIVALLYRQLSTFSIEKYYIIITFLFKTESMKAAM
jgi:hypothetical protein